MSAGLTREKTAFVVCRSVGRGERMIEAARNVVMSAWTDRHSRLHDHPSLDALKAMLREMDAAAPRAPEEG